MEEYFQSWDSENYQRLSQALKERIYSKYLIKAEVLQRDLFKCQNVDCNTPESKLTMHHVRFQKNGGKDSARNCITLCKTCHQGYHRGKRAVTYYDAEYLPKHLRGHTFKLGEPTATSINWKKVKAEMKKFRKGLVGARVRLSWEDIAYLMKFLELEFESDDGEDD